MNPLIAFVYNLLTLNTRRDDVYFDISEIRNKVLFYYSISIYSYFPSVSRAAAGLKSCLIPLSRERSWITSFTSQNSVSEQQPGNIQTVLSGIPRSRRRSWSDSRCTKSNASQLWAAPTWCYKYQLPFQPSTLSQLLRPRQRKVRFCHWMDHYPIFVSHRMGGGGWRLRRVQLLNAQPSEQWSRLEAKLFQHLVSRSEASCTEMICVVTEIPNIPLLVSPQENFHPTCQSPTMT